MRIVALLLFSWVFVVPVAAQDPPTDPDHAKIVDALVPEIEGVHNYVGQVNTEVKKALTQLEALTTQLSTLVDQQTALADQVGTVKTQVTTVNTAVTALAGQVTTLDGKVGAVSTAVTALAGQVTALDGKVVALDTKVAGLEGDVLTLPTEIAAEGIESQLLTTMFYLEFDSDPLYFAFIPGSMEVYNMYSHSVYGNKPPYGMSSSFGTAFPAGTIDTFSFAIGGRMPRTGKGYSVKTCDITITLRDDGKDTVLSGTVTAYDYYTSVPYLDPDTIDIEADSIINLSLASNGCGNYYSTVQAPRYVAVSMRFTPAAAVEEVETPKTPETPEDGGWGW